ncbi:MAG TPA: lysylphosphatidylglycerol synthase domain-containing protein [Thermoanaerobaculia bacterium]|nr:lysylphosphatidylglycerol synthase domain-containing protein [Thermoanaerobaculia bacterium]
MKGRLPRLLGVLALLASVAYLATVAVHRASSFPEVVWSPRAIGAFAAATGIYLLMLLAGSAAWFLLLRSAGAETSLVTVLAVCGLGQAGKYLPGNVGQYLGRAALARQHGIPLHKSVLTLGFETTGLIVTAAACALLTGAGGSLAAPWKIALLAAAAVAAPFLLVHVLERWFPGILKERLGVERLPRPSVAALGACLALYAAVFAGGGLSFDLLARGLFGAGSAVSWWQAVPAFALSWVLGFITPGAPAGLGVREALLVSGTAALYGPGAALSTALAFRLVTVLGDGIAFLAGAAFRRA